MKYLLENAVSGTIGAEKFKTLYNGEMAILSPMNPKK